MKRTPQWELCIAVFAAVFVIHAASPVVTSFDSRWSVHTAQSILREGNANLDEYGDALEEAGYYGVERVRGHWYSRFPLSVPALAIPAVAVADAVLPAVTARSARFRAALAARGKPTGEVSAVTLYYRVEQWTASLLVALTALFIFLLARTRLGVKQALLVTFIFAFCTSAWSVASRALWQHGPSMLFLTVTLYLLVRAREKPRLAAWAGLPLACAYVVRPVNSLSVAFLGCYVLVRHRRHFPRFVLGLAAVLIPFVLYNLHLYGALLPPYYQAGRIGLHPRFMEALAGNLVSPARGLLVFSPVLLFSLAGGVYKLRRRPRDPLDMALAVILLAHWVVISMFPHWWAGHSYGPRFFSDMLPYLVWFLFPVVEALPGLAGIRGRLWRGAFALCVTTSLAIHFRGAWRDATVQWNVNPVNVDRAPERIWDWRDPPFLRGIGWAHGRDTARRLLAPRGTPHHEEGRSEG